MIGQRVLRDKRWMHASSGKSREKRLWKSKKKRKEARLFIDRSGIG